MTWSHAGTPVRGPRPDRTLHREGESDFLSEIRQKECFSINILNLLGTCDTSQRQRKAKSTQYLFLWLMEMFYDPINCLSNPLLDLPRVQLFKNKNKQQTHSLLLQQSVIVKRIKFTFVMWVRTWFAVWWDDNESAHHSRWLLHGRSATHPVVILWAGSHQLSH